MTLEQIARATAKELDGSAWINPSEIIARHFRPLAEELEELRKCLAAAHEWRLKADDALAATKAKLERAVKGWCPLTDKGRIVPSMVCDDRESADVVGDNKRAVICVEIRPAPKRRKVKRT